MGAKSGSLPYDAEVLFLENPSNCYINLQVNGNARLVGYACENSVKRSTAILLCSTSGATSGTWFGEALTTSHWGFANSPGNATNIYTNVPVNFDLNFNASGATGTVAEQSIVREQSVTQGKWYLFSSGSGTCPFAGKIYYLQVYQNNELVRDFIPVRVGQVGYLFDKISGELFGNSGSGTFAFGPDVVSHFGYAKDGLVFMLDGIDKGDDNTAWTDLIGNIKFPYNAHSTINTDSVETDGVGCLFTNSIIPYLYNISTIEICFYSSNQNGVVFYTNGDGAIGYIHGGAGISFAMGTGASNNQYNLTKPSGNSIVSITNDNIVINGQIVSASKVSNSWGITSYVGIGAKYISDTNMPYARAGKVFSIRIYNRKLTSEEMQHNQQIDNQRFNLGIL